MSKNLKPTTYEAQHGKPVTRRELLASGVLSFSASMVLPSWLALLARSGEAQAAELVCRVAGTSNVSPFIGLKLSGGAALSANFVPHTVDRQLLPSYSKMGMGSGANLRLEYEFANRAPFYASSQILAGIRATATMTSLTKTSFVGVCVRSQDDSSANKFDFTALVSKAGISGKILPNLGRSNTVTGVNNSYAFLRPPAPLIVSRYEDIVGSLGVSGSLAGLSDPQKRKLFETFSGLTALQTRKLASLNSGETLSQLVQCGNNDNSNLISGGNALNIDPLSNAAYAAIWGITAATSKSSQDFVFASLVYNALNGNAGTVNLEIGGYDYHNNTRTTGDQKDNDAGRVIGRIIASMELFGKKAFLAVTSDGSVTSPESNTAGAPWSSDRGAAGSAYLVGYSPNAAPTTKSFQIGHYTDAQAADDSFLVGGDPEKAAAAMFANYMSFNGQLGNFENVLPRIFSPAELDLVTSFGG